MNPKPMAQQSIWTAEYEASLYLREVDPALLALRYNDLIQNLWSTDRDGKVHSVRDPNRGMEILRLLFHVILEQTRRGSPLPGGIFDSRAMINEATAAYVPPLLKSPVIDSPDGFAKFGKRDHIRNSFERGIFRIAPASSYDDPSLNGAQADKELQHFAVTPNERLLFKLHGVDAEGNEVEANARPVQLFRYMDVPDFYVWCCGITCDLRMLHDFQAEALLLVRDVATFKKRFLNAVEKAQPGCVAVHSPVTYYDPYTVRRDQLKPIFSKNLKYLYQNEYRFAWKMPPDTALSPFMVELGPLDDIAEFYETV